MKHFYKQKLDIGLVHFKSIYVVLQNANLEKKSKRQ